MTRTPPTLEELVRQPERVTEAAREALAGLLAEVERLRVGLWARPFDGQERGGNSPPATRLLTAPQVAEALGVPVSYVYALERTGRLPAGAIRQVRQLRTSRSYGDRLWWCQSWCQVIRR